MRVSLQSLLLLALIPANAWTADVPSPERLWEYKVSEVGVGTVQSPSEIGVTDLRFSPDGTRIAAVVIGKSESEAFLLVLDVANPNNSAKYVVDIRSVEGWRLLRGNFVFWNPSGRQVLIGDKLVRIPDGTVCSLPPASIRLFFVGPDHLTVDHGTRSFGPDCQEIEGARETDGQIHEIEDVSAERGLVCFFQFVSERWSNTEKKWKPSSDKHLNLAIVDIRTGDTVRRLPVKESSGTPLAFADGGNVLCTNSGGLFWSTVTCWEVDTGKEIALIRQGVYIDIKAASRARRIVVSNYDKASNWIPLPGYMDMVLPADRPKRVIWDFASGKELASWKSKAQEFCIIEGRPIKRDYCFDISPNGEYIVEGGAGVLSLYRIKP